MKSNIKDKLLWVFNPIYNCYYCNCFLENNPTIQTYTDYKVLMKNK